MMNDLPGDDCRTYTTARRPSRSVVSFGFMLTSRCFVRGSLAAGCLQQEIDQSRCERVFEKYYATLQVLAWFRENWGVPDNHYAKDVSDAAWVLLAPRLPAARPGGRPRTTDIRAVINAIFYLLRTGCQWRLLPREFPAWGTVYHYFRMWKNSGVDLPATRNL